MGDFDHLEEDLHDESSNDSLWMSAGGVTPVSDMSDSHLENSIQFLERRGGMLGARLLRLTKKLKATEAEGYAGGLVTAAVISFEMEQIRTSIRDRGFSEQTALRFGAGYEMLWKESRRRTRERRRTGRTLTIRRLDEQSIDDLL